MLLTLTKITNLPGFLKQTRIPSLLKCSIFPEVWTIYQRESEPPGLYFNFPVVRFARTIDSDTAAHVQPREDPDSKGRTHAIPKILVLVQFAGDCRHRLFRKLLDLR
jgi:hypothetical protein